MVDDAQQTPPQEGHVLPEALPAPVGSASALGALRDALATVAPAEDQAEEIALARREAPSRGGQHLGLAER